MRVYGKFLAAMSLMAAAIATTTIRSDLANAAAPPPCTGKDMLAEMRKRNPAAYNEVLAAAKATINANAVFWKIEQAGKAPSYLLGTMHVTDKRITTLSPKIAKAFDASKRVVLEVADMSAESIGKAMAQVPQLLVFTDGRRLSDMLDGNEFALVQSVLTKAGMPAQAAAQLKPWLVYTMMAIPACERARVESGLPPLDMQLERRAKADGKDVIGLETAGEQLRAMASIPIADQVKLLRTSIKFHDRSNDMFETLIGMYQRREMGAAWPFQIALARMAGVKPQAFESFRQNLLVKRNHNMRDRAVSHLRKGGTFMAVGALHLPGRDGLVALLRDKGFTVSAVKE